MRFDWRRWGDSEWHSSCMEFLSCPPISTIFGRTILAVVQFFRLSWGNWIKQGRYVKKADKQSAWVQCLFAPATEKTALPARLLSFACLSGEWETEASRPRGMESSHGALTGVVVCLVLSVGSQCLHSPAAATDCSDHLKSVGWKYSLLASALPLLATLGLKRVINNLLDHLN